MGQYLQIFTLSTRIVLDIFDTYDNRIYFEYFLSGVLFEFDNYLKNMILCILWIFVIYPNVDSKILNWVGFGYYVIPFKFAPIRDVGIHIDNMFKIGDH